MHCTASGTDARRRGEPGPRPSPPTPAAAGSSSASAGRGTAPKTHRPGRDDYEREPQTHRRSAARRAWSQAVADASRRDGAAKRWTRDETCSHTPPPRERERERNSPRPPPTQPLTRLSKNRKKRGSVSAGHGRIGKHRKHPGGRGNAGGQHHMRTLFDQFHPGYFGKVGMRQFHRTKARYHCPMINVEMLWSTLPEGTVAPAGQAPVVDVTQHGFFKVGGKGLVAKPMVVKAKLFTAVAEKKIKAAGGACILV